MENLKSVVKNRILAKPPKQPFEIYISRNDIKKPPSALRFEKYRKVRKLRKKKQKTKQNKCNFYSQNWFKISNNFKERYGRNILLSKLTDGVSGTLAGVENLADFAGTVALGLAGTAKFLLEAACKCIAVCLMLSLTNLSMIDLNHPESKINIS